MGEIEHTPGPWHTTPQANLHRIGVYAGTSDEIIICDVTDEDVERDGEAEANARLIAAAPTMLEALGRIAGHTDPDAPEENYRSDDPEGCMDTVFSIARAAIARANGEAP